MAVKHTIKHGFGWETREVTLTRGKAIRLFCIECSGYNSAEVLLCPSKNCVLFPYRLGKLDPAFNDNAIEIEELEELNDIDTNIPIS